MTRIDRIHTNDWYQPDRAPHNVVQDVRLHTLLLTNEEATLQSDCPGIHILMMHDKAILSSETHSNDARQSYCLAKHTPTMCYKVIVQQNTLQRCITRKRTTRTAERLKTRESSLCSREDLLLPMQASPVSAYRLCASSSMLDARLAHHYPVHG